MRIKAIVVSTALVCTALSFSDVQAQDLLGYDTAASTAQRAAEQRMDGLIDAREMDAWLKQLSETPHHAGSAAGRKNAETIADLLKSWGYDVAIESYDILLPTPRVRKLGLTAPTTYTATLTEETLADDPSTARREHLLPPYNAFSTDGDVEGELVYVNYGRPEDYEILERNGIDVSGKIVIARYGKTWRGIKPKLAGEKGAIGTIIYSDPSDDGYGVGDVYPEGPFKNDSGVQRGSVMDMPTYPGDVLTPGVPAVEGVSRLDIREAVTITRIPVLPISYRDALPLLSAMGGDVVPEAWRGALPITYHFGPGPARVHLQVAFDWNTVKAYNVIARLEGSRYPEEWVVRGNHHDGWNHGASDPVSGLVSMLAEAKAVATLAREGKRPLRTLVYAAWDAEEPGLIGSTEWVEEHADALKRHAVAYLNTDSNARGFISIGGSHVLERFLNQVIEDVDDPRLSVSLKERRRAHDLVDGDTDGQKADARNRPDLRIYAMGSGSDYTPFLQHLGVASANFSFGGEADDGSYHTLYDTYEHFTTWQDPGLVYGATLARVTARATTRLANAPRLPFEFQAVAETVDRYVDDLELLVEKMRSETAETNRLIAEGSYGLALNPDRPTQPPALEKPVPHFNFAPLKNAVARLLAAADIYAAASANNPTTSAEINRLLFTSERLLTREAGLDGRPWYKHYLYAPGFYTGYGVKTVPGVREAIEQRQYDEVDPQIVLAAEVLNRLAGRVEELSRLVGGG
jgi:N-acetylated-alpha-linked acidic dipeptidase